MEYMETEVKTRRYNLPKLVLTYKCIQPKTYMYF